MSTGAPSLDTAAVVAAIRDARTTGTSLRVAGAGTWLDAGRPVRATTTLSLAGLRGITAFEPDDFTITARAGTTLAEIAEVATREGRWLTLDPHGSSAGSIGATVATASWGPLASGYGTPRDHVLGCEIVTGAGEVVRAGGRVVKNVAGFDLVRLVTGAWGTLGVITEVTLRLRARPEMERSIAVTLDGDAARRGDDAGRWLRTVPFRPLAAELCAPALSERLGLGARTVLLVRLGGNEALVRSAVGAVEQLGVTENVDGEIWERLRSAEPAEAAVVRLGTFPASVGTLWSSAGRVVASVGGWMHATLSRGVVRCVVPAAQSREGIERLRSIMKELHAPGSRIVERLPEALWPEVPSATADPLSKSVRRTFDPDRVLNPGILDPNA